MRYCLAGDTAHVLSSPGPGPIGVATCAGHDESGRSLWELTVHGAPLPGRWVIVDRRFRLVE